MKAKKIDHAAIVVRDFAAALGTFMRSLEVDDLNAAVDHLRSPGAGVGDSSRGGVAFVSMKSTHGVNLQLVQRNQ